MKKMSKADLGQALYSIKENHRETWMRRNPFPVAPTPDEIKAAIQDGRFTVRVPKCGCRISHSGYAEIAMDDFVKVHIVQRYREAVKRHKKKRDAVMQRITIMRDLVYRAAYYKAETTQEAMALVDRFAAWRPTLKGEAKL